MMKRLLTIVLNALGLATIAFLMFPSTVYAQSDDAGAAVLCLCGLGFLIVNIAILVWVIKDAQARGTSAGAWLIIVLLFGVFGLLAYLVARPKGKLMPCPACGKMKPIVDPICPHCGKRVV
jgi:ABC-type transport system involved in multi-copper enzyme maturation permease subunit